MFVVKKELIDMLSSKRIGATVIATFFTLFYQPRCEVLPYGRLNYGMHSCTPVGLEPTTREVLIEGIRHYGSRLLLCKATFGKTLN